MASSSHPRKNSVAIIGIALGDEGKGRLVDNVIQTFLHSPEVSHVYVIRYQGGSNAGHTIYKDSKSLALHQVPSGVLYEQAIGIMDRGMVIHLEDLRTEVAYIEKVTGSLQGRLWLSEEAILATDLERAEEALNKLKQGDTVSGTGRGIGPAYAHAYDRLGMCIYDLLDKRWEETLGRRYDAYTLDFAARKMSLATLEVPDFKAGKESGSARTRPVGTKAEFLKRLRSVRTWLLKRKMAINTFTLHQEIYADSSKAVLFEGAQAMGLHPWLGTRPDVTASDTSLDGIKTTGFWRPEDIEQKIGIIKLPYTSSVGFRRMPTHVDLPKNLADLPSSASSEQRWAAFIREEGHEYGTTTGRPRDILYLDLPMLSYNCRMSGISALAGTHLDLARPTDQLKICVRYEDAQGKEVAYQPGLRNQQGVTPVYEVLPGWDGAVVAQARKPQDLPDNAVRFLRYIASHLHYPLVSVTTGPHREQIVHFTKGFFAQRG